MLGGPNSFQELGNALLLSGRLLAAHPWNAADTAPLSAFCETETHIHHWGIHPASRHPAAQTCHANGTDPGKIKGDFHCATVRTSALESSSKTFTATEWSKSPNRLARKEQDSSHARKKAG